MKGPRHPILLGNCHKTAMSRIGIVFESGVPTIQRIEWNDSIFIAREPLINNPLHRVLPNRGLTFKSVGNVCRNLNVGVVAAMLTEALSDNASLDHRTEIAERWKIWRTEKASRRSDNRGSGVNSATIFHELMRGVDEDAIVAVDVGNNTYSFGRYFECSQQAVLMSGYLGSIGFALPAAIGAWAATQEPDRQYSGRQVVSVSGDGGLGQYLSELTTVVKYNMNL